MGEVVDENEGKQSERMLYTLINPCLEVHDERCDLAGCS